jgi:hypothetical protein
MHEGVYKLSKAGVHMKYGLIQQVHSKARSLGNYVINKSGDRCDQTSQNGREHLGDCCKSNRNKNNNNNNDLRFKIY